MMSETTASLPIPFAIGEEVWWVGPGWKQEMITCPECAGTRALTLILGNGESVSLACDNCSLGYDPPRGVVKRTYYHHEPEQFQCLDVRIDSATEFRYLCHDRGSKSTDLYRDRDECAKACTALNEKRKEDEERDRRLDEARFRRAQLASF